MRGNPFPVEGLRGPSTAAAAFPQRRTTRDRHLVFGGIPPLFLDFHRFPYLPLVDQGGGFL